MSPLQKAPICRLWNQMFRKKILNPITKEEKNMKKILNQEFLGDLTISRGNAQGSGFLPRNETWACDPWRSPLAWTVSLTGTGMMAARSRACPPFCSMSVTTTQVCVPFRFHRSSVNSSDNPVIVFLGSHCAPNIFGYPGKGGISTFFTYFLKENRKRLGI